MDFFPPKGLFTNASPHAIPPGSAQIQENMMSIRHGLLEVRRGQLSLIDLSFPFTSTLAISKVRRNGKDGIVTARGDGSVGFWRMDGYAPDNVPTASGVVPCIAQSRQGDVIIVGGGGRGKIGLYDLTAADLGITAPAEGPIVTVATGTTGGYTGSTYYFGYRWGDALGRWSNLSPVTSIATGSADPAEFTVVTGGSSEVLRVTKMQLYRSLADDPNDFFLVTEVNSPDGATLTDSTADSDLVLNTALPIVTDDGALYARRHDFPPSNAILVCPFKDRYFYAGQGVVDDVNRNMLYYSEVDLPESVPNTQNALMMGDDFGDADDITGLFAFSGLLYIGKRRHLYRFTYSSDPRFDGSIDLARNRGVLNQRCFAAYRDTLFLLDDTGPWRMGGEEEFDLPIHDYWTDGKIDYTKSSTFFIAIEPTEQVARYYVCLKGYGWTYPKAALCYSIATGTWWVETYSQEYFGATIFPHENRQRTVVASSTGFKILSEGVNDLDTLGNSRPIIYRYKTGIIPIAAEEKKSQHQLSLAFQAIDVASSDASEEVRIRLYFDHELTPASCWGGYKEGRVRATHGSTDLIVDLTRGKDTWGNVGYERVQIPVRGHGTAYGHRFVTIELLGVQNAYAHRFYSLAFE